MVKFKNDRIIIEIPAKEPLDTLSDLQCDIPDLLKEKYQRSNNPGDRFTAIILDFVMNLSDADYKIEGNTNS